MPRIRKPQNNEEVRKGKKKEVAETPEVVEAPKPKRTRKRRTTKPAAAE